MADVTFEITSYSYLLYTQGDHYLVWDGNLLKVRAAISCQGSEYTTTILVLADDSYLPADQFDEASRQVFMFARPVQFPWFIDMLRNEKPIYCRAANYPPAMMGYCYLTTTYEPIGELERLLSK